MEITSPLEQEPSFLGSGRSRLHVFSVFFQLLIAVAFFKHMFYACIDLWGARGGKIVPFGLPVGLQFRTDRGPLAGLGPKPTPGTPKGNCWVLVGAVCDEIGMNFEHM